MERITKSELSKQTLLADGWREDGKTWFPGYKPAGEISTTVTSEGQEYCYIFTSKTRKLRWNKDMEQLAIRMKRVPELVPAA
jgi:hypothetical protein